VAKRTASAKKQARAGARRAARNKGARSEVKTLVVKARHSLVETSGDSDRAAVALDAIRALDRAAAKGILHARNAARRKGRLAKQLAKAATAPAASAKGKKTAAPASKKK
jgi:small subunit ribosomal protein S20